MVNQVVRLFPFRREGGCTQFDLWTIYQVVPNSIMPFPKEGVGRLYTVWGREAVHSLICVTTYPFPLDEEGVGRLYTHIGVGRLYTV